MIIFDSFIVKYKIIIAKVSLAGEIRRSDAFLWLNKEKNRDRQSDSGLVCREELGLLEPSCLIFKG